MRSVFAVGVCLLLLGGTGCTTESPDRPLSAALRADWPPLDPERVARAVALVERGYEQGTLNGVMLVVDRGQAVFEGARGLADIEREVAVEVATGFPLGNITKLFTAAAVMVLAERGQIALDAPLSDYRPAIDPAIGRRVTILQLLAMTSGLPRQLPGVESVQFDASGRAGPFVDALDGLELLFEPGSQARVSHVGYWILGAVIEAVTDQSFEEALGDLLFQPAGMEHSGLVREESPGLALGYSVTGSAPPTRVAERLSAGFSSAGLYSSAPDLVKWCHALATGELLSRDSLALIAQRFPQEIDRSARSTLQAGGVNRGFMTLYRCEPDTERVVVSLSNRQFNRRSLVPKLTAEIVAALDGRPADNR